MKIIKPPDFLSNLKSKHLLLDTCVFIDAFVSPTEFAKFFKGLKENDIIIVSIDLVKVEFIRGSREIKVFQEKRAYVDDIIDAYLPITNDIFKNMQKLVELFKEEGNTVSVVDLMLGGLLMKYPGNLMLLTRNINDFPTNIFTIRTFFNLFKRKSIQSYGIYYFVD